MVELFGRGRRWLAPGLAAGGALCCLVYLVWVSTAMSSVLHAPGRFDPWGAPPGALGRHPVARPWTPRVLAVDLAWTRTVRGTYAAGSEDPRLLALAHAETQSLRVDLTYGLPGRVAVHGRFAGWKMRVPAAAWSDGGATSELGLGDSLAWLSFTPAYRQRLWLQLTGGMRWPTGTTTELVVSPVLRSTPFTTGATEPFIGAQSSLRLVGNQGSDGASVHVHAGVDFVRRRSSGAGLGFLPYPDRWPLVAIDGEGSAYDRLDLTLAVSVSRGASSVFAAIDWPLLRDASDLVAPGEILRVLSPGFRVMLAGGVAFEVAGEVPFAGNDPGTKFDPRAAYPEWGVRFGIATDLVPVDRDRDGDGVGDLRDACPEQPEDRDGFADGDGCPDRDNDGDGVPDELDRCPLQAEDVDGFEDEDGCPELDNDGDGLPDAVDACPSAAEDLDGFEDGDGCPDVDNDGDGIPDAEDDCPNRAEDLDGVLDEDGCPEEELRDGDDSAAPETDPEDQGP